MVVPWKPGALITLSTEIILNPRCVILSVFARWRGLWSFSHVLIRVAIFALGLVAPAEKLILIPVEQSLQLGNLLPHPEDLFWDTRHRHCLHHLVLVQVGGFHVRLKPEIELLLLQFVWRDLPESQSFDFFHHPAVESFLFLINLPGCHVTLFPEQAPASQELALAHVLEVIRR